MRVHVLDRAQVLPGSTAECFEFFADAFNLEAITPPWLGFRVVTPGPIAMGVGALIEYRLRLRSLPIRWLTRIEVWEPGRRFVDVQVEGPYRLWHHTHSFEPDAPQGSSSGTVMRDVVRYALPFGAIGGLAHAAVVRRDLDRIFDFRRDAVSRMLRDRSASAS